jgi:hypothetical protein
MLTVTVASVHLHASVPPWKSADPFFTPLSTDG